MEGLFLLPLLFPLAAVGFFGWLGIRFVRAKEQANLIAQSAVGQGGADTTELARLEETVEALQEELHRLQERQAFMEKLLQRPTGSA